MLLAKNSIPHHMAKLHALMEYGEKWNEKQISELINNGYSAYSAYINITSSPDIISNEKNLAGFIIFKITTDECEIITFIVNSNLRRQGVGRFLIDKITKQSAAKYCKKIFLEVREDNILAINFYKNSGFTEIGVRKNYYKVGNDTRKDAIIMSINI